MRVCNESSQKEKCFGEVNGGAAKVLWPMVEVALLPESNYHVTWFPLLQILLKDTSWCYERMF